MGRAPCCEKVGLKKGRWTAEEDQILTSYIQTHGEGSWRSLPKNAGLLRCGKSCRLRWINYLRKDVRRGNITTQEEELIVRLHQTLGNRWSLIAGHLPGRTDNEIKNYWNSHLSRKIYHFRRPCKGRAVAVDGQQPATTKADDVLTSESTMGLQVFVDGSHGEGEGDVLEGQGPLDEWLQTELLGVDCLLHSEGEASTTEKEKAGMEEWFDWEEWGDIGSIYL